MSRIGVPFGIVTIILILINAGVFYGIQMQDTEKIYDLEWGNDCIVCKQEPNAIYEGEKYICPKSAETAGGYNIEYCQKAPENCCYHTKTDQYSLIPKFALEKPWTFITSMFMHGGSGHLLGNMIFLFFIGSMLERLIGWWRFLSIYFVSGLIGGLLVLFFIPEFTSVVGASGAIFGVLGALVILRPWESIYIYFMPMPLIIFGGFYVLINLLAMVGYPMAVAYLGEGVAYSAHFGGAIGGIIFGLYFRLAEKRHLIGRRRYY